MGFQLYSADLKLLATQMTLENVSLDNINIHLQSNISPTSLFRWKRTFLVKRPAVYLDKLQAKVLDLTSLSELRATISRELRNRLGLSLLITQSVHPNQSLEARTEFMWQVAGIPPEFLVFIDESGVVGRDASRTCSWAKCGGTKICQPRHTERSHWTILPVARLASKYELISCTQLGADYG